MRTRLCIKTIISAQLLPVKTMKQFINDRCLYRGLILGVLILNCCF
jgi:hypothetical protein